MGRKNPRSPRANETTYFRVGCGLAGASDRMVIRQHKPDREALLKEEQRKKAMVESYYQTLRESSISFGGDPNKNVPEYRIRQFFTRERRPGKRKTGWVFNEGVWELLGTEYVVWKTNFKAGGVYFWNVASVDEDGRVNVLTGSSLNSDGHNEMVLFPKDRAAMDWVNTFILGLRSRYERYGLKKKARIRSHRRREAMLGHSIEWIDPP